MEGIYAVVSQDGGGVWWTESPSAVQGQSTVYEVWRDQILQKLKQNVYNV